MDPISITVKTGDALDTPCDVLVLKYAQRLYGVDWEVASRLESAGMSMTDQWPKPDDFRLIAPPNTVRARTVLFVGVPTLGQFDYAAIRRFASCALRILAGALPATKHIVLTLHGVGFGLDESEAFRAELAGILDVIQTSDYPDCLEKITIIEEDQGRAKRLSLLLTEVLPDRNIRPRTPQETDPQSDIRIALADVGTGSRKKRHVFAAMPFDKTFDDRFHYGIHQGAAAAGFLCERGDRSSFVGDVMDFVKRRIDAASFVVADLTGANPNVYLEVGYAWGRGIPTVLVACEATDLLFDVQGHRCLIYENSIKRLEEILTKELTSLASELHT
jgi:hypothetical protein